jgi:ABC-2 type transport system permease protein
MTGRGNIYDLGYRGYEGERLGRRGAITALLTHSLRTAYGLGRGTRSKIVPMGLAVFAVLPALLALGIVALVSQVGVAGEAIERISPIRYSTVFPLIATLVMLFCASQAPELFGRDQRAGVLPLYFTRAVSRDDYAIARLLGLLVGVVALVLAPQLILFLGRVLAALDPLEGLRDEIPSLPTALAVAVLAVGLFGSVAAAISASTPRRSYATAAIIAVFVVPSIVAQVLAELAGGTMAQIAVLLSPGEVLEGVNSALFDVRSGSDAVRAADLDGWVFVVAAVVWIAASVTMLLRRYRGIVA